MPSSIGFRRSNDSGGPPLSDIPWKFLAVSPGRQKALSLAERVADAECPVLILGPTGVGKDILAEDIHAHSRRRKNSFIAVNCGALSPHLVESELFGHVRGAYTTAIGAKTGVVELANGGTLFLDEIGELSADAQVKLLRFLAKGTFWPVGAQEERRADVRVICATNRNLPSILDNGFRADLYYRISVMTIAIPPLVRADVLEIAKTLLDELLSNREEMITADEKAELIQCATLQSWRGGVRELRNALERFLLLRTQSTTVREVWSLVVEMSEFSAGPATHTHEPEVHLATDPLSITQCFDDLVFLTYAGATRDVRELANRMNRSLPTVYERLKRMGIRPRDLGQRDVLEAAQARVRDDLAPHVGWIQAILKGFRES